MSTSKTVIHCDGCSAQVEIFGSGEVDCLCGYHYRVSVPAFVTKSSRPVEQIKVPVVVKCECGKHIMTIAKPVFIEALCFTCPACEVRTQVVFV